MLAGVFSFLALYIESCKQKEQQQTNGGNKQWLPACYTDYIDHSRASPPSNTSQSSPSLSFSLHSLPLPTSHFSIFILAFPLLSHYLSAEHNL